MIRNLNRKKSSSLLANNYVSNLGYIYKESPYIVPITYFFDGKKTIIIYSSEGQKTFAMRKKNRVSIQVSEIKDIDHWESVLALGTFEELSGIDAKSYLQEFAIGVKDVILKREGKNLDFIGEFSSKEYINEIPIILKITIDEITGRVGNQ